MKLIVVGRSPMLRRKAELEVTFGHRHCHDVKGSILAAEIDRHFESLKFGVKPQAPILVQRQRERFFDKSLIAVGLTRYAPDSVERMAWRDERWHVTPMRTPELTQAERNALERLCKGSEIDGSMWLDLHRKRLVERRDNKRVLSDEGRIALGFAR